MESLNLIPPLRLPKRARRECQNWHRAYMWVRASLLQLFITLMLEQTVPDSSSSVGFELIKAAPSIQIYFLLQNHSKKNRQPSKKESAPDSTYNYSSSRNTDSSYVPSLSRHADTDQRLERWSSKFALWLPRSSLMRGFQTSSRTGPKFHPTKYRPGLDTS